MLLDKEVDITLLDSSEGIGTHLGLKAVIGICGGNASESSGELPHSTQKRFTASKSTGKPRLFRRMASSTSALTGPDFTMNFQYDLGSVSGLIT